MAQTLFRQWFVERRPDLAEGKADEGWKKKPLDEVANYLNGLACQNYPPRNENDKLPVLKIKELRDGISKNSDWATSKVENEYIVQSGDIIFSWSGSLMIKLWHGTKCVLNQHLFKVTSTQYPNWYVYFWTKRHMDRFVQIANSKSTTMGHIKRNDLSISMVCVPQNKQIKRMDKVMMPLFEKIKLNSEHIATIENLRDILLPKLMSGKIGAKNNEMK